MASTKLSKVSFNKTSSSIDFTTPEYLIDFLEMLKAKSRLPIKQMLSILVTNDVDTVACSSDDSKYSFFASYSRNGIAITVKKLGEETIEFTVSHEEAKRIKH
jgi:hypothetical protein